MPELPEVQTTVDGLNKSVIGKTITDFWTDWPKYIRTSGLNKFKESIIGSKFKKAHRRAKYVMIDLSNGWTLVIHLKMTGHLLYGKWQKKGRGWHGLEPKAVKDDSYNKYIRAIFSLNNGKMLAFSDLRRFGKIMLIPTKEVADLPEIKNLGPEPLDKSFTLNEFKKIFKNKKGKIKTVLMDPKFISGIGNIYSDEILWLSDIHPLSIPENIPEENLKKMYNCMKETLKQGIKFKGSSNSDFRRIDGTRGLFQNKQQAYRRTGNICSKKDGGIITRIKVGGRSTHFCNVHQKIL